MPNNDNLTTLPSGTGSQWQNAADEATRITDQRAENGSLAWADVLLSHTFRTLAQPDPHFLRIALTQLAATVTAWVEDIDRKAGK